MSIQEVFLRHIKEAEQRKEQFPHAATIFHRHLELITTELEAGVIFELSREELPQGAPTYEEEDITFGQQLRTYRSRLGMTQKFLAQNAHLSPTHLNRIEKDKRNPPSVKKIILLADTLHLRRREVERLVQLAGYSIQALEMIADDTL